MGIKSKNKFIYIASFIVGIYMLSLFTLTVFDLIKNRKYVLKDPYFNSTQFDNEIASYCLNLHGFYVYYNKFDKNVAISRVTKSDLDGLKLFYEDIIKNSQMDVKNKYSDFILEAEKSGDKDKVAKLTNEKNKKLKEIEKKNTKSDDELKKEIILRFHKDYENIKKAIESRKDIKYYIKNTINKEIYTNLETKTNIDKYIKDKSLYAIKLPLKYAGDKKFREVNGLFNSFNWEGYIIIPKKLDSSDYILKNYNYYNSVRSRLIKEIILSVSCLILGLFILIGVKKDENIKLPFFNKIKEIYNNIPLDLKVFIFAMYTIIMGVYLINISFFYKPLRINHFISLTIVSLYILYFIFYIKYAIKLRKNKNEFLIQRKGILIKRLLNSLKNSNINKNIKFKIVFIMFVSALLGAFIFLAIISQHIDILIGFIITILYLIILVRYLFKKADYLNELLKATEKIASGNLDYVIVEKGNGTLSKIANNINNMKDGYKKSVEEKVKSERLKSELITNVSHDLKTPLTSIINYINLLKKENLSEDEIKSYISVLDRKSERLKALIEDLFEASKMSSGAVELNIEKVDVNALLKQSIAEFHEKIKNSSLDLKFKYNNNKVYANLDGKKTWRVFENLINNIIKYSQPNTRVYIDLIEEDNKIIVTMKNISCYEMNFSTDEIFERFKRGDKSRSTEGSGLGLAISKSIVEMEGGTLNIKIDGDLFKVIIEFSK